MKNKEINGYWQSIIFSTALTPTILVWSIVGLAMEEPVGLYEIVRQFIILIVSGMGGLGIGVILANKLIEITRDEK